MQNAPTFGQWIKQRRKALDQTQDQLARLVGCSTETIRKVETGKLRPSLDIAERLVDVLAISDEQRAAFLHAARAPLNTPLDHAARHPALRRRVQLPTPPTSIVGRNEQTEAIATTLLTPDVRLVTLLGPGGIGKTRLALLVATHLQEHFEDGVYFVPLASIHSASLVAPTIAQVLGVAPIPGSSQLDGLRDYLAERHILLVLDNFEQVLDAAPIIADLLSSAARLHIVATSRAALRIYGERAWDVPALELPPVPQPPVDEAMHSPAVALFVDRARSVKAAFALNADNIAAVVAICVRLDGLPLAIELAAARIRMFTPRTLLARLESRLDVLTGGPQDLPYRQQTLRNTIAWSYDLLETDEQHIFACFGVFGGSCDTDAMEAVGGSRCTKPVFDLLAALADKSLLEMKTSADGEPRWIMLQTTQEYARERLQMAGTLASHTKRHADYFLAFAELAEPQLLGPSKDTWLARLDEEHGNLRAVFDALPNEVDPPIALRLAAALWRFWQIRGHIAEGRQRLQHAFDQAAAASPGVRARALAGMGTLAFVQGDFQVSESLHERSLQLFEEVGDEAGIAFASNNIATQLHRRGHHERALELMERALDLFRAQHDAWGIAFTLNNMASVAILQGQLEHGAALLHESLALARQVGDDFETAIRLHNLGDVTLKLGQYVYAAEVLAESIALFRILGNNWGVAHTLHLMAIAARHTDGDVRAEALLRQAIRLFEELGDKMGLALCLEGLAEVYAHDDLRDHDAARLLGAATLLRETIDAPVAPAEREAYDALIAGLRARLGTTAWATAFYEGKTFGPQALLRSHPMQQGA